MKKIPLRKLTATAILGAVGFVLMLLEFPLINIMPAFIKFDFSELPALIAAFAYGPIYGVIVCLIKNLLHLFVSQTMGVGELSNFVLGAIFVLVAGGVYNFSKNRKGALLGCVAGSLIMSVVSVATNYFIVYPAFAVIMKLPMERIVGMYKAILPSADTLFKALLIFNLPFNFIKGLIITAICFIIYKKLSPILKHKIYNK